MRSRSIGWLLLAGVGLSALPANAADKIPEGLPGRWILESAEGAGELTAAELHLTATGDSTMRMVHLRNDKPEANTARGVFRIDNGRIIYTEKRDDQDEPEKTVEFTLEKDNLTLKVLDPGATLKFKRLAIDADAARKAIHGLWKIEKSENADGLSGGELEFFADGRVVGKLNFSKDGNAEVREIKDRFWLVPNKYLIVEHSSGIEVMQYSLDKDALVIKPTDKKDLRIELKRAAK